MGKVYLDQYAASYKRISIISRSKSAKISKLPRHVRHYEVDVAQERKLQQILQQILHEQGSVDSVAFFQRYRGEKNFWHGNLNVTLGAVATTLNVLKEHFISEGDKSVVMMASIASHFVAWEQNEGYHAAKSGLLGLMRYYANHLGSQGVRVNAVSPGVILKPESKHYYLDHPEFHQQHRHLSPLQRMGTAKEVADVCHFLLGNKSSFITGQEIIVDGGVGIRAHASSIQFNEKLVRK